MKLKTYTPEFRAEAVKLVLAQGLSLEEAAQRIAMPKGTLCNWVSTAKRGNGSAAAAPGSRTVPELEAEVARLRRELVESNMERDVLKKATARSTGGCNTFWSNVGLGGKLFESEEKMRALGRTKDVVVAEVERWRVVKRHRPLARQACGVDTCNS